MQIDTTLTAGSLTVAVAGVINELTTADLTEAVRDLTGIRQLVFDLTRVRYVSSVGLRLFLLCQRTMNAMHGEMEIRGCNEFVLETFECVGFDRIMKLV